MASIRIRTCPMCERQYTDYPSVSRTRKSEDICPNCGTAQAMAQFEICMSPTYQSRGIADWAESNNQAAVMEFLFCSHRRHIHLDWGDMDEEDLTANDKALLTGDRLFSSYNIPDELMNESTPNSKIWIITEADRSATTILFPDEY